MKTSNGQKIYFSQYEHIWSMNRADAIKLCMTAIDTNGEYSLDKKSFSTVRELKRMLPLHGELRVSKRYVEVNICLDWNTYDWIELFSKLTGINFNVRSLEDYRNAKKNYTSIMN